MQNLAQILADFISRNILPAKNIAFSEVKFQAEASNSCNRDQRTNRLEGEFVSNNVLNLSRRNLSDSEIQFLSIGQNLKRFCPKT